MDVQSFFYISAGIGVWVFVVFIVFVGYEIYLTLKVLQRFLENVRNISNEVQVAKDYMKFGALSFVNKLVGSLKKKL